jgi:alginate O-acetyltransferase complex protein AlgI
MAFSSNFFLFGFFPVVAVLYFLLPLAWRNHVLLCASLFFYAFDAGWMIWILIASILFNHVVAQSLLRREGRSRRVVFAAAIGANLAVLLYYKYANFLWDVGSSLLSWAGIELSPIPKIELPIGISFFTFQAVSYIADVNQRAVAPARRLVDFAMYHSLFPQLIAGPIVRYIEVENEIRHRKNSLDNMASGICRFCVGLGKKLIVADAMGAIADPIFNLPPGELTFSLAWLGLLSYTLQIYFDFSGYSDMAIGLGKMFGFEFPENFNQPYRARSMTEFWRRWHMTLSRWFRDYVYIPLGGDRHGAWRTYWNLFIVFLLCGIWHGAGYTFVVWGLYHGTWLVAERLYRNHFGELPRGVVPWFITLLAIMVGWVFFRSSNMSQAVSYLSILFGIVSNESAYLIESFLTTERAIVLGIGGLIALWPSESFSWRLSEKPLEILAKGSLALGLLIYAIMLLSLRSFNPFIYFRF